MVKHERHFDEVSYWDCTPQLIVLSVMFIVAVLVSFAVFMGPIHAKPKAYSTVYINMGQKDVDPADLKGDDDDAQQSNLDVDGDDDDAPHHISAHGSGVHIGGGYILTAAHVADSKMFGHDQLDVLDSNGREHETEYLWANHKYDVALLRIKDFDEVSSSKLSCRFLNQGERLHFEGNPLDLRDITTYGQVGNAKIQELGPWAEGYTIAGPIISGMSGGPALDNANRIVGINVGSRGALSVIVPGHTLCQLMDR